MDERPAAFGLGLQARSQDEGSEDPGDVCQSESKGAVKEVWTRGKSNLDCYRNDLQSRRADAVSETEDHLLRPAFLERVRLHGQEYPSPILNELSLQDLEVVVHRRHCPTPAAY